MKYHTIYADPPWMERGAVRSSGERIATTRS